MSTKNVKGVIIPRHDTAINWSKAVNFTPEDGELIIISADNATDVARGYYLDSEGNKLTSITVNSNGVDKVCTIKPSDKVRFKFGNGKDNVNALPFQTDALQDTASGSTILIDDISPVTHEMSVKISSDTVTDLTAVKVTRYGKNLIQTNIIEVTSPTGVDDLIWQGHISVSGKLSFSLDNSEYTPNPNYVGAANFKFVFGDGTVKYLQADGQHIYIKTPSPLKKIYFLNWGRGTGVIKNIQLEIGSSETDYEPYVEPTEYTPNADGIVNGVTSIYPNTTLMTDTDGVIIDCEYLTKLYTEVFGSANIKNESIEEYIDKKIEVSDTAPIEEENKIWLKPITNSSEYIVEEGTNGIWTYRIWSSGISECWGKQSISVTTSTSNNGYYTGSVGSLEYPSHLFISGPILNCTLKAPNFPGHLFINDNESSSATGTIYIAAHSNTTVNGYIHLSAKGRWK